jgi:hypothetical protein
MTSKITITGFKYQSTLLPVIEGTLTKEHGLHLITISDIGNFWLEILGLEIFLEDGPTTGSTKLDIPNGYWEKIKECQDEGEQIHLELKRKLPDAGWHFNKIHSGYKITSVAEGIIITRTHAGREDVLLEKNGRRTMCAPNEIIDLVG